MTEQEIITVINTIADNYEQGTATPLDYVSVELRKALARLSSASYNLGYKQGNKHGKESLSIEEKQRLSEAVRSEYHDRYASIERERDRLRAEIVAVNDRVDRANESQRRASEKLLCAILDMQRTLSDVDDILS